jgi:Predicted exonuclease
MALMVVDVATAPIDQVEKFADPDAIKAPEHYRDPIKIADYEERQRLAMGEKGALDPDLSRITGIGTLDPELGPEPQIALLRTAEEEKSCIQALADLIDGSPDLTLVTFNGTTFDWPVLMRRARYLGIAFPRIQLEHWKSPHIDVLVALRFERPQMFKAHSLQFYVKRLGWTDLQKPLSGFEESNIWKSGRWEELSASIRHDCVAPYRLGLWLNLYQPVAAEPVQAELEPIL